MIYLMIVTDKQYSKIHVVWLQLAQKGFKLVLISRSQDKLDALAEELGKM